MLIALVIGGMLAIFIDIAALIAWKSPLCRVNKISELPKVSVLVPMRNEEKNVIGLVKCLRSLDYPPEKIDILIGEDRSEDLTSQLLEQEIGFDDRFKVVPIVSGDSGLKAKANVIAQLIPHCQSSFYFITDADVRVPKSWIKTMLPYHSDNTGVIGGTTVVKVHDLWSGLQNIDWLIAQGLLFVAGNRFQSIAISGTNMMITSTVCEAIGGYHNIPFSLTEDIGILTAARKSGFSGKNVLEKGAMAEIEAQPDWQSLISQRARWTYGALRLPKLIVLLLLIRSLFLVFVLAVAWFHPVTAILLYIAKGVFGLLLANKVARQLDQKVSYLHFMCFEVFSSLISISGLIRYLGATNINWKGRSY